MVGGWRIKGYVMALRLKIVLKDPTKSTQACTRYYGYPMSSSVTLGAFLSSSCILNSSVVPLNRESRPAGLSKPDADYVRRRAPG